MGSLILPASGSVYLDTAPVIYSVEKHVDYWPTLRPMWEASKSGQIELINSELVILETLTGALRSQDTTLPGTYEQLLTSTEIRLIPITAGILRAAAVIRATTNLRTPDAIHVATALSAGCVQFLTNDLDLRRVTDPPIVILKDVV